jgi:hypothetical protein
VLSDGWKRSAPTGTLERRESQHSDWNHRAENHGFSFEAAPVVIMTVPRDGQRFRRATMDSSELPSSEHRQLEDSAFRELRQTKLTHFTPLTTTASTQ